MKKIMNSDNKNLMKAGLKQSLRALKNNKARRLFVALDAEIYVLRKVKELAEEKKIDIIEISDMKKLGEICDISVGAAVAVELIDKNDLKH